MLTCYSYNYREKRSLFFIILREHKKINSVPVSRLKEVQYFYVQYISKLLTTPQKSRSRFITVFSTCKDAFLKFERQFFYIG
jgi:hypothetical protein